MEGGSSSKTSPIKDPRKIARGYQLELCKKAVEENTIVYLGTGCGKTHIAVLLMYELGHLFRKPGKDVCIFLAPTVPLVRQQACVIEGSTNFKVQTYYGNSNHLKSHESWENEVKTHEVLVMTPQILLQNLRHCFISMECVALMIFDECHHAQLNKRHPYAQIMKEFYKSNSGGQPRIFGMTASPILGKGGSNQVNYSKCINSLEDLLNSKVYAVDDKDELESVAPSPDIKVYFYQPFNMTDSKLVGEYLRKLEELKRCSMSAARGSYPDLKDFKKKMKDIGRVHETLLFCLENVGMFGAMRAARILLAEDKSSQVMNTDRDGNECPQQQLLEQAASHLDDFDGVSFAAMEEPFFSDKLLVLIRILQKYRETSNAKCIIFVKRIIVARCLTDILNKIKCLKFWKCEYLVGCHCGSMTRKMMNTIVERFSSGEVNLLVATNVAEEGLDIQTCGLVVRFDLPPTVSSFIQSRGRARMSRSQYIFLVDREDEQAHKLLDEFHRGEDYMNKEVELRTSSETFDYLYERKYRVDTTGASISTGYSVSLLHRYCSSLPHDQFFKPAPKFFYLDHENGVICRVILPSNAAVRQVDSYPCQSRDESKRAACLNACKELHDCGALDDYLLPDFRTKKADPCIELSQDDGVKAELHEKLIPQAISIPWSKSDDQVWLYFYDIMFNPIPEDRRYKEFGLFMNARLPEEAETMQVDLHLAHGRIVKTALKPSGHLSFSKEEIILAEKFQELALKVILDRSEFVNEFVQLGTDASSNLDQRFYLLLPTSLQGHGVMVDWKIISSCLSSPVFSDKKNSLGNVFGATNTSDLLMLGTGAAYKSDISNSLVYNPLGRVFYFIDGFLTELNGCSQMLNSKKSTYVEHYKNKYGYDLLYPDQPLLKAKQLFCPRNLLINRLHSNTESREAEEDFVELPPEICWMKIIAFSKDIGSSLSLLPSLLYRLENLLVAIELKNRLSESFPEASKISAHRVLEALTTEKCLERFSLERLEMLGDSFLKYAVARHCFVSYHALDEGQLTRKRSRIVSNLHLHELAIRKGLQLYICDEMFDPSNFFALGRPCRRACDKETESMLHIYQGSHLGGSENRTDVKCQKLHRWLQKKTIADTVEALVGAFLVESGFTATIEFLKWLGIQVGYESAQMQIILAESEKNMPLINKKDISALEEIIGHRFQHKGLLLQSFIHPSYTKHLGGCYQRLEFLGDAVLDYLITSYLFTSFPDLKPGKLTDLRSITVNNTSFAHICVNKKLSDYLINDSTVLVRAIDQYKSFMDNSESLNEEPACPKVLGDIVESSVGAVLLDSGFNLDYVWKIMLQLLKPVLAFSSFKPDAIRELHELCQCCGFQCILPEPVTENGEHCVKVEVDVKGQIFSSSFTNRNTKVARRSAAFELLSMLKVCGYTDKSKSLEEIMRTTAKSQPKLIGFDEKPTIISKADLVHTESNHQAGKEPMHSQSWNTELLEQLASGKNYSRTNTSQQKAKGSSAQVPAKSRLFEVCACNYWNPPSFVCCGEEGLGHLKRFTYKVVVEVQGNPNTILECFSEPRPKKKAAEEHAAEGALWYLKQAGYN